MIELPQDVAFIIHKIEKAGFEAFAVGCCIRDIASHTCEEDQRGERQEDQNFRLVVASSDAFYSSPINMPPKKRTRSRTPEHRPKNRHIIAPFYGYRNTAAILLGKAVHSAAA